MLYLQQIQADWPWFCAYVAAIYQRMPCPVEVQGKEAGHPWSLVHLVLSSVMCHSHLCCAVFLHDQEWWLCNRHPYLVMLVCDVLGRGTKKKLTWMQLVEVTCIRRQQCTSWQSATIVKPVVSLDKLVMRKCLCWPRNSKVYCVPRKCTNARISHKRFSCLALSVILDLNLTSIISWSLLCD